MPFAAHLLIYFFSFMAIWLGSGLVVGSVLKLAHRLHLPAFTMSFFLLGLLTSLPELVIGLAAIADGRPEIFVGNLIGGVIIIFLLIIPLLGLVNHGVKAPKQLSRRLLLLTLVVSFTPSLLTGDQQIDIWEGLLCIGLYLLLFFFFSREGQLVKKLSSTLHHAKIHWFWDSVKILTGMVLLGVASQQVIYSTLYFAEVFRIAPFFMSLVVVSLGTNLPELSLVFQSIFQKNKAIELADFLGSAAANTLFFGIFLLLYPATVAVPDNFLHRFIFVLVGLTAFYFFLRSGHRLSRKEGLILLLMYIAFVFAEFRLAG